MFLKKGSQGTNIIYLQYGLRIMCISPGNVDGIFGNDTYTAVRRFQSSFGLNVDGIVGDGTWNKLKDQIKPIQSALRNHGHSIDVDGVAGPGTYNAILSFQKTHGLSNDGMVGDSTRTTLFNSDSHSSSRISYSFGDSVSDTCVEFIKTYEGFYQKPYRDVGGVLTIGYGSTHGWIIKKAYVTKEEATRALKEEINECAIQIKKDLNSKGVNLNQHQFDALCSFAYNCGIYALKKSTLYKKICTGIKDSSLKVDFETYNKAGGQFCQGLLNRRRDEYEMFISGDYKRTH